MVDRGHAFFDAHQCCLVSGLGLFTLSLIMNRETPNEVPVAKEERELLARRLFLQSIGKWSGAAIAAAVLAGALLIDPPETKAGAWINRRGGVGVAGSTAGAEAAVAGSIVGAEVAGLTAGAVVWVAGSTAGAAEAGGLITGRQGDLFTISMPWPTSLRRAKLPYP